MPRSMNRREFLTTVGASAATLLMPQLGRGAQPNRESKMSKPNLLFIFTDEQRQDTMRAYGNARIRTPNMDALAEKSVVFTRAYDSQPVCTPARATIMTGLYPHTTGCITNNILLDGKIATIAEMFKDRDYRFAYHGKWHLGDEIFAQHGFQDWESIEDGYRAYYREGRDRMRNCSYFYWLKAHGFKPDAGKNGFSSFSRKRSVSLPAKFTKPAFLAETMSRFIRDNKDRPWVGYVNFLEPHMPFTGPYNNLYDPDKMTLPANFNVASPDEPIRCRLLREHYRRSGFDGIDLSGESGWRRLMANYWGLVTLVDEAVGRILAALADSGAEGRTIIVFTTDHGDMMGSHRLLAKTVMFEEAVKVPLLVRAPGLAPHRVDAPVSHIDLVPTLLDLMSQPIPRQLQGHSLRPVLEQRGTPTEDHVFIEWNERGEAQVSEPGAEVSDLAKKVSASRTRTVISPDGWKLNLSEADKCELYHLPSDSGEAQNLFYSGSHQDTIDRLRERIKRWQERTKDDAHV